MLKIIQHFGKHCPFQSQVIGEEVRSLGDMDEEEGLEDV
jgi:hypothetical protein